MNKKKYHGGLKALLLLLFIMLLGTCSTCYAATDYTDFEIPIEFWENFINYINSTATKYRYGTTTTITAEQLKNHYDNNVKTNLKALFINNNADERNLMLCINNSLNASWASGQYLRIYYIFSNNSVNNIENTTSFYVSGSGATPANAIAMTPYNSLSPSIIRTDISKSNSISSTTTNSFYDNNSNFYWYDGMIDYSTSMLLSGPWFGCTYKPLNTVRLQPKGQSAYSSFHLENFYDINPAEPEEPSGDIGGSTGTITNPSGEVTGQIDLSGIENGIKDVKDTISGEAQAIRDTISGETEKVINTLTDVPTLSGDKISSGDISSALGFEFETDRYVNFWLELTNGLKNALLGVNRTITISFMGNSWLINLDDFSVLPQWLRIILIPFSTSFFVWVLVRWWKLIIDKLSSGNIDVLLKENSEERNLKFVLGGAILLDAIFNFILNVFFWFVGVIGSIVIYPVQAILVTLVPSIGDYLSIFLNFFRESVFPMISFAKELFLDITCCPRPLFTILITTLFARWAIAPAIRSILLIMNIWKIKSGGKTE